MAGKKKSNTIITVIIIILLFIILIGVMGVIGFMYVDNTENDILNQSYEDNNEMVVQDNKEVVSSGIDWSVLDVTDSHFVNAKRYSYHVLVEPNVTAEDLKLVSDEVIEYAKQEQPFNAITIYFHESPILFSAEFIPSLGHTDYAPNGEWGDANTVSTGDYSNMRPKYYLREKDWETRPSEKEIEISATFNKALYMDSLPASAGYEESLANEEAIRQSVGDQYGLSSQEVKNICDKVSSWIFQDLNS